FEISRLIQFSLEDEGFSCHNCGDGLQAFQIIQEQQPDLVILDLMIPGLDGLELCARIRQKPGANNPYILMLSGKSEEIDRVIGLSTGADDYLVKPFSPRELVARVRALLRLSLRQPEQHQIYRTQHFLLDIEQHSALRQMNPNFSEIIDLTNLEFNLLTAFVRYPNRVWNRTQLIDKLWGCEFCGDERVVDTLVARLRKKIEPDSANPIFIKTVTGVGYKFEDDPI
uniref:response regulator transcription factor n=2 Tax=Fischerella TaxID=1190 RepID=UPI001684241D